MSHACSSPRDSYETASRRTKYPIVVAGIIERSNGDILIVLPLSATVEYRHWQFPRGPAMANESAEAAMRRFALETLGLTVEIVIGQPPLVVDAGGAQVEARFFFCGIITGTLAPGAYSEIRWVSKAHLREYEFDDFSRPVAEWLVG